MIRNGFRRTSDGSLVLLSDLRDLDAGNMVEPDGPVLFASRDEADRFLEQDDIEEDVEVVLVVLQIGKT